MTSAPEKVEDISEKLKNLTLSGVKPIADQELGSGAYGKVYKVKYRGVYYHIMLLKRSIKLSSKEYHRKSDNP